MFFSSTHLKYTLLSVTLILCSFKSFALGQLGHQVVCQVSFEHLPTAQQSSINNLFKSMPAAHKKRLNEYTHSKPDAPITFAKSCVWADAIKRFDDYKQYASWHYLNVPRSTTDIKGVVCAENCVAQAIITHQQQVTTETDDWKKLQALMFLGHWLGDIHQPLHVSYASDWGGNKVKLTASDKARCDSLHWYWDECVLTTQKMKFEQWVSFLAPKWDTTKIKPWAPKNVWQWANESYQILTSPTFKYCQRNNGKCESYEGKVTLPDDYQTHFTPIINQRMVLAAKRLSAALQATSL